MTFEHDKLKFVMPSLPGDEINESLSDDFDAFKRTEAISVLMLAAE